MTRPSRGRLQSMCEIVTARRWHIVPHALAVYSSVFVPRVLLCHLPMRLSLVLRCTRSEVSGTANLEPRTSDRARLACLRAPHRQASLASPAFVADHARPASRSLKLFELAVLVPTVLANARSDTGRFLAGRCLQPDHGLLEYWLRAGGRRRRGRPGHAAC